MPLRCTCFFSCVSHKCTQKQFFFFCLVFLYDSIVYGDAFQTWLNINEWAFLSLLNARWLCELLWKHIYFLIDEIHIKNTNTNMLLTQIHLDAFAIYTILFSLVFNLFAHFFFSSQEKTNFPLSMSLPLILPCACIFMRRHGSWKIPITIAHCKKHTLEFNFLNFRAKKKCHYFLFISKPH